MEKVDNIKYLGVVIDSSLKWNAHIDYLCSKLKFLVAQFYKVNKLNNINIVKLIYFAFAQSILQYGIVIWGNAFDTHLKKLFIVQKLLLRAALGKPRLYPSEDLFDDFNVLTIRQLYIKNLVIYINKNMGKFLTSHYNHNLRPSSKTKYIIPKTKSSAINHQLFYTSSKLINIVPDNFIDEKLTKYKVKYVERWVKENYFFNLTFMH